MLALKIRSSFRPLSKLIFSFAQGKVKPKTQPRIHQGQFNFSFSSSLASLSSSVFGDYQKFLSQVNDPQNMFSKETNDQVKNLTEIQQQITEELNKWAKDGWKIDLKEKQILLFSKKTQNGMNVRIVIDNDSRQFKQNPSQDQRIKLQQIELQKNMKELQELYSTPNEFMDYKDLKKENKKVKKANKAQIVDPPQEKSHGRKAKKSNKSQQIVEFKKEEEESEEDTISIESPNFDQPYKLLQTVKVYIFINKQGKPNTFCAEFNLNEFDQNNKQFSIWDCGFLPTSEAEALLSIGEATPFKYRVHNGLQRHGEADKLIVEEITKQVSHQIGAGLFGTMREFGDFSKMINVLKITLESMQKRITWLRQSRQFL